MIKHGTKVSKFSYRQILSGDLFDGNIDKDKMSMYGILRITIELIIAINWTFKFLNSYGISSLSTTNFNGSSI